MATKEARQRANVKYRQKAYDRVELNLPKGKKEIIQQHASLMNESINSFVSRSIDETMTRDNEKDTPST